MFRFEHIDHLWGLLAIPVLILLFLLLWQWRKNSFKKFGQLEVIRHIMPEVSRFKHQLKFGLLMLALVFLFIGWANPQWGTKKEKVKRNSADIMIALDISQSMLAKDIAPNRMERAKRLTQDLINKVKGDRVGLIYFAGSAYLQMPMTTDYSAAKLFAKSAHPNLAGAQGTAIEEAIYIAQNVFREEDKNHKALVIITDGEDHDSEVLSLAENANENGMSIFTIGVGTENGEFIPIEQNGRTSYKRDKNGNPVRTALNEKMLKDIADAGGGSYYNISQGNLILNEISDELAKIEKRELEMRMFNEYESYFQYFIGIGLLLMVLEFFISYKKSGVLKNKKDIFKI